ncbi:MAG: hypothetical protein SOZ89_00755 [Peptoniphilaceae bacterium]|nr:hypothetical protein [Peptoniphilaceae bacterium]MDY3737631.1 hypothetical protein [Peptoniphilaceae bacterium]
MGEVDVKFRTSATISRLYRIKFKIDILKDISNIETEIEFKKTSKE